MSQPLLIIYGNCQTDALRQILNAVPFIRQDFEVRCASSFDVTMPNQPTPDEAERCAIFFEQHSPTKYSYWDNLPSTCEIVSFPPIDCNVLWPWSVVNPASTPEPPLFPHGRFPYGDAVLNLCIENGMDTDAIIRYYRKQAWQEHYPPLERLQTLEHARLTTREKHCDVKMAQYLFDNFRDTRLHWTANHPTTIALCELAIRLMRTVFPKAEDFERSELVYKVRFTLRELLGEIGVPLHPELARELSIRWYREDARYPYYGSELTLEEYLRAFIEHAVAHKRELAAVG